MAATAKSSRQSGLTMDSACDLLVIVAGFVLLFCTAEYANWGDGAVRLRALEVLLKTGEVIPIKYPLIGSLFASPLLLLGQYFGSPEAFAMRFNFVLFGVALIFLYRTLRDSAGPALTRTFLIILLFGSMFLAHVPTFYGETFTALAAAVGIAAIAHRRQALGWPVFILGVLNMPGAVLGFLFALGRTVMEKKRFRFVLWLLILIALFLVQNRLQRGSFLLTGYEGDHRAYSSALMPLSDAVGFGHPLFFGVLSLLFSFGKGILFFAPGIFLPLGASFQTLAPNVRRMYGGWLLFALGLLVLYAKWWDWSGDFFWGPRFLLFASVPASFALALGLTRAKQQLLGLNLLTLAALLLSFWVGLNGFAFNRPHLPVCNADHAAMETLCWHVPEYTTLWSPFVFGPGATLQQTLLVVLWGTVFLWIGIDLLRTIVKNLRARIVRLGKGEWRW